MASATADDPTGDSRHAESGARAGMGLRAARAVAPAAAFGCAWGIAHAAGFRMTMRWHSIHFLDPALLLADPAHTLWYLHSQPPGLNILLAAVLHAARAGGLLPEQVAAIVFPAIGCGATVLLHRLLFRVSGSSRIAWAGTLAALLNPALYVFSRLFFYPMLLYAMFLALLAVAGTYLHSGRPRHLYAVVAALGAITLTRSLYSPAWACMAFALILFGRRWLDAATWRSHRRTILSAAGLLACLLWAWPLKNYALFGQFTYSSWMGINLTRALTVPPDPGLIGFVVEGRVPDDANMRAWAQQYLGDAPPAVLAAPNKESGWRNWNHYIFLVHNPGLTRKAFTWWRQHPRAWMALTFRQYKIWASESFRHHSAGGKIRGSDNPAYQRYAAAYSALLFAKLEHLTPAEAHWTVPSNLFSFVVFPAVMVAFVPVWFRRVREKRVVEWILLLAAWCVLWSVVPPSLTDGIESNRMRFATAPLFLLLLTYVTLAAAQAARAWGGRRTSTTP